MRSIYFTLAFCVALACSAMAAPSAEARLFNRGCSVRSECGPRFQPVRRAWRVATYPFRALGCN